MIAIKNKIDCCGCHACFNICPKGAIDMKEDEYGFKYPTINEDKCIDCGLCEKVCPIINKTKTNNKPKAYACINKNEDIRLKSSSGGIFTLIAEAILESRGVVFGVELDKNFNAVHSYVEKKEDLYKFRGSKYVQSAIGSTYKKAKEFLDEGRYVLFTGTPCQIEGLYSFLKKDYEKLYTQDIICHGVPSPRVWRKYKEEVEKENNSKIVEMNFRDKSNGWSNYSLKYIFNDKNTYIEKNFNSRYMRAFLNNISLRDSCYECSFKKINRISNITLADFWGIQKLMPKLDDNKGTSLMIINNPKGEELLAKISKNIVLEEVDFNEAIQYNPSMFKSSSKNKNRESFFEDLEKLEFNKLEKKYFPAPNFFIKLIRKIKGIMIGILRKIKNIIS